MAAAQSDSKSLLPSQQSALPFRIWTDCLGYTELRSGVVALGNLLSTGLGLTGLHCELTSRYLQRKNEAANY